MTDGEANKIGRLATEAFDRSKPGPERLPKLTRLRELLEAAGTPCAVTVHWQAAPSTPFVFDFIQDEIDRIGFQTRVAELLAERR